MSRRRPFWHIPTRLALGLLELLHGIPQARADILRAKAESGWLACLRAYLDLLDRLHVPVHQQREIVAQILSSARRKRDARQEALNRDIIATLEPAQKLCHPGTFLKRTAQVNLRPLKRKLP